MFRNYADKKNEVSPANNLWPSISWLLSNAVPVRFLLHVKNRILFQTSHYTINGTGKQDKQRNRQNRISGKSSAEILSRIRPNISLTNYCPFDTDSLPDAHRYLYIEPHRYSRTFIVFPSKRTPSLKLFLRMM